MKKLDLLFQSFMKACGTDRAGAVQQSEMRNAFFAGASVLFEIMVKHAANPRVLQDIHVELRAFGAELDERCKNVMTVEDGKHPDEPSKLPPFVDLSTLSEDQRIDAIGNATMQGQIVGCLVDARHPQIAARYIEKMAKRFPGVRLIKQFPNGSGHLTVLQFGPVTNG